MDIYPYPSTTIAGYLHIHQILFTIAHKVERYPLPAAQEVAFLPMVGLLLRWHIFAVKDNGRSAPHLIIGRGPGRSFSLTVPDGKRLGTGAIRRRERGGRRGCQRKATMWQSRSVRIFEHVTTPNSRRPAGRRGCQRKAMMCVCECCGKVSTNRFFH